MGKKVLVVDWDLEAPGAEHFFFDDPEELRSVQNKPGLIDLLMSASASGSERGYRELLSDVTIKTGQVFQTLTAGARTSGYFKHVRELDVKSFYEHRDGGHIIERLRAAWKEEFDFVLVDSRTGITDIGGICTIQLPDILALVFTATRQSLVGAVEVAGKASSERQKLPFDRAQVPVLPLPSRFDTQTEHAIAQEWLDRFETTLKPLYEPWLSKEVDRRRFLEVTKIPYVPYFSFGEKLPVLEVGTTDPSGLGFAYETIAALIASNLQQPELVLDNRDEFVRLARTTATPKQASLRPITESALVYVDIVGSTRLPTAVREAALKRFHEVVSNAASVDGGDIAMTAGDGVLLSFENVRGALACALKIQESLAVRAPIVTPMGPLRARMGMHAGDDDYLSSQEALVTIITQIANKAREGQIVASERVRNSLRLAAPLKLENPIHEVRFVLNEDQVDYISGEDVFEQHIFDVVSIVPVTFTESERRALFEQAPETKGRGGFQAFLVGLQKKVNPTTKTLDLTIVDRERIARYAHDYKGGGWQGRLRRIFGRTLGPNLGRLKGASQQSVP